MQRRHIMGALAAAPATTLSAAGSGWSDPFAKSFRDSFAEHWRDTREYTLAVLDAMPGDAFDSKPHPAQRSFADQLTHLGMANVAYFRAFGIGEPPPRSEAKSKEDVRAHAVACFDYVAMVLGKLTEKDLLRTDIKFSPRLPPHSGTDLCMRAYMHTAHHRGQLVVYLRVNGIVPPAWKFEPTAG
ncbi:MAG: DinB family protein [Bryobacteraceae bacterium]